jgi:hypothetical protein
VDAAEPSATGIPLPLSVFVGGFLLGGMALTTGTYVGQHVGEALASSNAVASTLITVLSPSAMLAPVCALLLQIARRPSVGRLWRALMVPAFLLLAAVDGVRMWHDTGVPVGFNAVIAVAGIWCLFRRPARRYFAQ